ncbi:hypothetical protein [Natronorubrum daqingense]|uniref:Uncharacterized protein n=1 Tax=Natronorubrum daqingense TaxID=588898 RepID=A0A1N7F9M3_9EURY|nr:hypothetical protein [Natronorubrum daqingense]APX97633.1 hypothetical protein BB347_14005 [Natronorubrum daqingense]SIR97061.1 hypothetical protein SAMN05421809_3126 [Natronorubrum daqingense]
MNTHDREDAAYTELTPDSWHQNDDGNYYIDCPECGSAATLMNVVSHGRCNGYLDQREDETELDEESFGCTAKLWFELGYVSDADPAATDSDAEQSEDSVTTGEGVPAEGSPAGSDGTVDDD